MTTYVAGTPIYLFAKFYSINPITGSRTLTDTTVTCTVVGRTTVTFSGGDIIRNSVGSYRTTFTPTLSGTYTYGFSGTGGLVGESDDVQFTVKFKKAK